MARALHVEAPVEAVGLPHAAGGHERSIHDVDEHPLAVADGAWP